ncbi:MAG: (d)CMP kinase [Burkholderiales bacterium]|jgi:cytidylate kinase
MSSIPVIAIDGPTASGKGTIAQRVADALGFHYLDSGALYRLTALSAQGAAVDWQDGVAVAQVAAALQVRFDAQGRIWLGGQDATEAIRSEAIGVGASKVAVHAGVRAALLQVQRDFRQVPGLVADGRDMASVVFPDAVLKIFLTATAQARAQRRHKQLIEKGISANLAALLQDLQERDARDSQRAQAPLVAAQDALVIDSTDLSVDQTVQAVLQAWQAHSPGKP